VTVGRPARFRQIDITRAIRAAKAAGVPSPRVEIGTDGRLVILTDGSAKAEGRNSFDEAFGL
jgi:hypothetical protein